MSRAKEIKISTPPSGLIVSVADMKKYLNVEHSLDDDLIQDMIEEATEELEGYLGLRFLTQTVTETFDYVRYPSQFFVLSVAPLQSLDTFQYLIDDAYTAWATSNFLVDTYGRPALLQVKPDSVLPESDAVVNRYLITYTVGYGAATDVPLRIRKAIKLRVAGSYEQRADYAKRYIDASYRVVRNLKNHQE